ncbi:MAG: hypothetical protein QOH21_704 [Acidobacteriota bacterium]|jgi:citrate synthase|nr:hypothetical protein [Acidobacteriota bacterium]
MTSPNNNNDRNEGGRTGEVRHADPDNAAVDPRAAAQQEQVREDHDALEESARRVESSVPSNGEAATDREAAATQDRVKADHDRMQESARRVEASVPADVRDTPVQAANLGTGSDTAHANAEVARESARRVEDSVRDEDRDRR